MQYVNYAQRLQSCCLQLNVCKMWSDFLTLHVISWIVSTSAGVTFSWDCFVQAAELSFCPTMWNENTLIRTNSTQKMRIWEANADRHGENFCSKLLFCIFYPYEKLCLKWNTQDIRCILLYLILLFTMNLAMVNLLYSSTCFRVCANIVIHSLCRYWIVKSNLV